MKTLGIQLNKEEEILFEELMVINKKLEQGAKRCDAMHKKELNTWKGLWKRGGKVAHKLYMSITSRNIEVQYHPCLLKNRLECDRCKPQNLKFHEHIHAIKALVQCIESQPPEDTFIDKTLDISYKLKIYNAARNHNHSPTYIMRIEGGWKTQYWHNVVNDDKRCTTFLKHLKGMDMIDYPQGIDDAFESLWEDAALGMTEGELQVRLEQLAHWISWAEHAKPKWWGGKR